MVFVPLADILESQVDIRCGTVFSLYYLLRNIFFQRKHLINLDLIFQRDQGVKIYYPFVPNGYKILSKHL